MDPIDAPWFHQIRNVMFEMIPKLNDAGNMQGTYLVSFPGVVD